MYATILTFSPTYFPPTNQISELVADNTNVSISVS